MSAPVLKINVAAANSKALDTTAAAEINKLPTPVDTLYSHIERTGQILGEGISGIVELVRNKDKPTSLFAMKSVRCVCSKDVRYLQREIEAISLIPNHECLLSCYDVYYNKPESTVHIISEYMDLGSLSRVMKLHGAIPAECVQYITHQVLRGLSLLHDAGKLHRDIKPANVLLSKQGFVKISDFGLARDDDTQRGDGKQQQTFCGTLLYMAPERLEGSRVGPYDGKSDVWSVGISVLEMLTGKHPLSDVVSASDCSDPVVGGSFFALYQKVRSGTVGVQACTNSPDMFPPDVVEFISKSLAAKAEDRLRAKELLTLNWMVNAKASREKFMAWVKKLP
eukprot:PhF_6_TR40921/c0_g1_i1/m.61901/K04368/MAP2K1, MEK1; mitogen-activated protein kinase kinase 1